MLKQHQNKFLSTVAAALAVLVLVSGIMVSETLLTVEDNIPSTEFCIDISAAPAFQTAIQPMPLAVGAAPRRLSVGAAVQDDTQVWRQNTTIPLFLAQYDNALGDVTVRSVYGDKVIAPGTSNSYHFYIRNTGTSHIDYTVQTEAQLQATAGGVTYTIPLDARFYNTDNEYLLGTATAFEPMTGLDGIRDRGQLSARHYTRYTLDWQWPFEGDDTLDTLLGNLAAEGDRITVAVTINVTATGNEEAAGGIPQTGDTSRIGLWAALLMGSGLLLLLLLFGRRRKEAEAN